MRSNPLPAAAAGALLLAALIWLSAPRDTHESSHAAAQAGAHVARQPVDGPVQPLVVKVGTNEMLVLDVPLPVTPTSPLRETRHCFVWRDLEFKTSTVSCLPTEDGGPPLAPPPPSFER